MSNDTITLTATKRDVIGKQVRALRSEGKTPAVVHDHGKQSIHITVVEKELKKAYGAAGKHHPIELVIDGKKYTTVVKEVVYKPATNLVFHAVLQSVNANETVKTAIPVHLTGEIPAERASLLVLHAVTEVEVEALSKDLVDALEVDASVLVNAGDTISVSDLQVPKGVVVMTDPELTIATVEVPRDQVAEADAAAAELAADAGTEEVVAETTDETTEEESKEA